MRESLVLPNDVIVLLEVSSPVGLLRSDSSSISSRQALAVMASGESVPKVRIY